MQFLLLRFFPSLAFPSPTVSSLCDSHHHGHVKLLFRLASTGCVIKRIFCPVISPFACTRSHKNLHRGIDQEWNKGEDNHLHDMHFYFSGYFLSVNFLCHLHQL